LIYFKFFVIGILVFMFSACEKESVSGLAKVHWDRDMCTRCVMVVSDRKNTVQVANSLTGKKYMFDDIGCMTLWFSEENINWKDKAVVWITDVDSGEWINARKAFYNPGNITPMSFGFSAHKVKSSIKDANEVLSYDEVLKIITENAR
jgi:copper chaperone NosL